MMSFSEVWNELGRLEELIRLALKGSGSIPESIAGTGFWRSVAGVLQPTASNGLQGQIAGMNAGGTDIKWQATWDVWVPVSGIFTPAPNQIALLVDTTGPQTTITTPANPYDGQMLIVYDYEGGAATNPIILTANTGTTIDDPSFPGNTPGAGGHIAQQGMTAIWKFFAGAAQWQLIAVTTPYVATPNSWSEATWFIDPSNRLGTSSDTNAGTSQGKALRTYAELVRRWNGTTTPTLTGPTCAIEFLSGHPDATDPVICTPYCQSCFFLMTASGAPIIATGVLSGVVANDIAANQALNAVLPVGTVAGSLIVNPTRANSFARAFKNLGGNTWQISQPINAAALPFTGPPVQNNAWANGDTVNVFDPATNAVGSTTVFNINVAVFAPVLLSLNATFNDVPCLANINLGDTNVNGIGFDVAKFGGGVTYFNVSLTKHGFLNNEDQAIAFTRFTGCDIAIGIGGGGSVQTAIFDAGQWRNTVSAEWPVGATLDCGFMLSGFVTAGDNIAVGNLGTVYVDGNFLRVRSGFAYIPVTTAFNSGQAAVYGSGGLDAHNSTIVYTGTAVNSFPCAGGLKIRGNGNAYSYLTTAGLTAIHEVALTPANLDAAAGAAGFGGYAVWPGVGCYTNLTQT